MDLSGVPVVGKALFGLGIANIALTAAKQIFDKVAAGSKADTILGKICAGLAKFLSFVTANTQAPVTDQSVAPAEQPAVAPEAPKA